MQKGVTSKSQRPDKRWQNCAHCRKGIEKKKEKKDRGQQMERN